MPIHSSSGGRPHVPRRSNTWRIDMKYACACPGPTATCCCSCHYNCKLDGQDKARREAARRRNSECKINFNSRNSSRSNGSRPTGVQRAVIGRRRGALVAVPRCRPVTVVGLLHSELRRRAASRRALPALLVFVCGPKFITSPGKVW